MKDKIKGIVEAFLSSQYGKTERGVFAKECLQDATKLSPSNLSKCVGEIDPAKWNAVRLTIDGCHPIYDFRIVEIVEGRIFKKKLRVLTLIGTNTAEGVEECATVADLAAFVSANKFDMTNLESSIAHVGIGTVDCSGRSPSNEIYFNYDVSSVEFDREKLLLSFATVDRLFT